MIQVFRDIFTQEFETEYRFDREIDFCFQNFSLQFDSGQIKALFSETELKTLSLELQIKDSQQALKLRDYFHSCGYSDIREISALIFSPKTTVWLCFEALPEILAEYGAAFFSAQNLANFLETEVLDKGKLFKSLDQAYQLIKIDVRTKE